MKSQQWYQSSVGLDGRAEVIPSVESSTWIGSFLREIVVICQ